MNGSAWHDTKRHGMAHDARHTKRHDSAWHGTAGHGTDTASDGWTEPRLWLNADDELFTCCRRDTVPDTIIAPTPLTDNGNRQTDRDHATCVYGLHRMNGPARPDETG